MSSQKPLIIILGPTACGKTKLAVNLAEKFNGEIVSADSRQVYKYLDIGTGKDLPDYETKKGKINYHLINVCDPRWQYSLADYKKEASQVINSILKKKKIPFLVGGTGLYLKTISDGIILPPGKPNPSLRSKLEKLSLLKQVRILRKIDPEAFQKIDLKNSRRIVRAIEINLKTGKNLASLQNKKDPIYDPLFLGIKYPLDIIRERIKKRLEFQLKQGLVVEVKDLRKRGLSWERLDQLGLEYRYVAKYLKKELSYEKMVTLLGIATGQFAKRQLTWFKREPRISWIKNKKEAIKLIKKYLKK